MAEEETGGGLRAAALEYAKRASVFPCVPAGKEPLVASGFHAATRDPRVVEDWWEKWPDANVALAIPPGMVVVDVDPRNGGVVPEDLPQTRMAATPSGGWHLYYLIPAGTTTRKQLAPGIDLKVGGKGYVLLPPSCIDAVEYRWVTSPREPLASLPAEWVERLTKPEPPPRAPVETINLHPFEKDRGGTEMGLATYKRQIYRLAVAAEGTRNETLFGVALIIGRLVGEGELDETFALEELLLVAERIGLTMDEAVDVSRRGFETGLRTPR